MCSTHYASQQELMRHLHQMHSGYFKRHIQYSINFRRPYNQEYQDSQLQNTQNTRPAHQAKCDFHVCGLCDKVTKQKAQFYKHMREEHPQYVRENWFHCSNCQKAYLNLRALKVHLHHCCNNTLAPTFGDVDLDAIDFHLHWLQ